MDARKWYGVTDERSLYNRTIWTPGRADGAATGPAGFTGAARIGAMESPIAQLHIFKWNSATDGITLTSQCGSVVSFTGAAFTAGGVYNFVLAQVGGVSGSPIIWGISQG